MFDEVPLADMLRLTGLILPAIHTLAAIGHAERYPDLALREHQLDRDAAELCGLAGERECAMW